MLKFVKVFLLPFIVIGLASCASSNVSRDAASNVDKGMSNAKQMGENFSNGDIVDSYQNSSQTAKGALLGGTTGAVVGTVSSFVGFVPGTLAGMVLGASYGNYIDSEATLSDQLSNRGATMIMLGDQIMLSIPSARIFEPSSDKIKPSAYSTLNLVASYLNSYTTSLVKISAYTDNIGNSNMNLAISAQQAQSIERYLVAKGINTRVIYSQGYGGTNLIAKSSDEWGKSDNYRIEITTEKLIT